MSSYAEFRNYYFTPEFVHANLSSNNINNPPYDEAYIRELLHSDKTIMQYEGIIDTSKMQISSSSAYLSWLSNNSLSMWEYFQDLGILNNLLMVPINSFGNLPLSEYEYLVFNSDGFLVSTYLNTFVKRIKGSTILFFHNKASDDTDIFANSDEFTVVAVQKINSNRHKRLLMYTSEEALTSVELIITKESIEKLTSNNSLPPLDHVSFMVSTPTRQYALKSSELNITELPGSDLGVEFTADSITETNFPIGTKFYANISNDYNGVEFFVEIDPNGVEINLLVRKDSTITENIIRKGITESDGDLKFIPLANEIDLAVFPFNVESSSSILVWFNGIKLIPEVDFDITQSIFSDFSSQSIRLTLDREFPYGDPGKKHHIKVIVIPPRNDVNFYQYKALLDTYNGGAGGYYPIVELPSKILSLLHTKGSFVFQNGRFIRSSNIQSILDDSVIINNSLTHENLEILTILNDTISIRDYLMLYADNVGSFEYILDTLSTSKNTYYSNVVSNESLTRISTTLSSFSDMYDGNFGTLIELWLRENTTLSAIDGNGIRTHIGIEYVDINANIDLSSSGYTQNIIINGTEDTELVSYVSVNP